MQDRYLKAVASLLLTVPSMSFAIDPYAFNISWSPTPEVFTAIPTLGAYWTFLLIALVALTALRVSKQNPSLMRSLVLTVGCSLLAAGGLFIDKAVSGTQQITESACTAGNATYSGETPGATFGNTSDCALTVSVDIPTDLAFD